MALRAAAEIGDAVIVKTPLDTHVNVNARGDETLLTIATRHKHADFVLLLLLNGGASKYDPAYEDARALLHRKGLLKWGKPDNTTCP